MALNYLGIQPTKEQHQALRQQVQVDPKGTVSFGEADEMERLKHERNDALEEVNRLKETKAVVEETRALRSRIHLAEAAQRQAHGMEMDYEEVIRLLEAEITELKAQLADYSDQNKAIQEIFSDSSAPLPNLSERRSALASQTSLTPLGRNGRNIPAMLALESKELVKSVRATLDMDCLPYGWEEAYTADGIKYFIKKWTSLTQLLLEWLCDGDELRCTLCHALLLHEPTKGSHVTQTTSWIHPVMSALNLSCSEENEEDCFREPSDHKS
ncbi:Syntaxin-binding protein 4 [Galemys pyrenaicus]|uniref:Syntaxin-binding protein 4 n=1 Tax=Galemys pyrenaicus TaxID=202257 RepID=A0A8J6DSK7_GALPY|nr:Syntaxin-binding protein 4 [Galemys pyrenaicus]